VLKLRADLPPRSRPGDLSFAFPMFLAPSQKLKFLQSTSVTERMHDMLECFSQVIIDLTARNNSRGISADHRSDDEGDDDESEDEEAVAAAGGSRVAANPMYDSAEDSDHEEPPDAAVAPEMDQEDDDLGGGGSGGGGAMPE